jgi:diaminopimelate decarboxylase
MNPKKLMEIADKFKTPAYVYDEKKIRENYRDFHNAFKKRYENVKICYAYKANTNLAICNILRQEGAGADVLSMGELQIALDVGIKPEDIILTSTGKTDAEIELAVSKDVVINIDSIPEIIVISEIAKSMNKTAKVSIRVNPGVNPKTHPKIATGLKESKFGVHIESGQAMEAYKTAYKLKNLEVVGIHSHIGSQILETDSFKDAAKKVCEFILKLKETGIKLKFVNLGGGLGISYTGEDVIGPGELADAVIPVIEKLNENLNYDIHLLLEPGRRIVGNAGILLTRVLFVKETPYRKFVNVDCGFTALIRPAMYDAYHRVAVINKLDEPPNPEETYTVAGNLCESGDIFARDRKLPKPERGDLIGILDVGAYGFAMASNYNSRVRPCEILIRENGDVNLIRKRENHDDLLEHQRVPEDLLK